MDDEKLKKSNDLKNEISLLQHHIKIIEEYLLDGKKDRNSIHIQNSQISEQFSFKERISPIKTNDLIMIYRIKVIAEFERLKLEFKNL